MITRYSRNGQGGMVPAPAGDWVLFGDHARAILAHTNTIGGLRDELKQEKIWKEEDPRMLREQLRIADAAYNYLHAQVQVVSMQKAAQGIISQREIRVAAMNIVNQILDRAEVPVEKRQAINDECDEFALRIILSLGESLTRT